MEIDGKKFGMVAVFCIALLAVGFVINNGLFIALGIIAFIVFIFGAFFGAKGSLRIRDIFPS